MENAKMLDPLLTRWKAYYLVRHEDSGELLRGLVLPAVTYLSDRAVIDRFYFVRYQVGGPHVRLRWRCKDAAMDREAEAFLSSEAKRFFRHSPSKQNLSPAFIREHNQKLQRLDPTMSLEDGCILPDNSWACMPVGFETERFGGASHIHASLDAFTIASIVVLLRNPSLPQNIASFISEAVDFIMGFTSTLQECLTIAELYRNKRFLVVGHPAAQRELPPSASTNVLKRCAQDAFLTSLKSKAPNMMAASGLLLAQALKQVAYSERIPIAEAHLHLLANRHGFIAGEEVLLSSLVADHFNTLSPQYDEEVIRQHDERCKALLESDPPMTFSTLTSAAIGLLLHH